MISYANHNGHYAPRKINPVVMSSNPVPDYLPPDAFSRLFGALSSDIVIHAEEEQQTAQERRKRASSRDHLPEVYQRVMQGKGLFTIKQLTVALKTNKDVIYRALADILIPRNLIVKRQLVCYGQPRFVYEWVAQ